MSADSRRLSLAFLLSLLFHALLLSLTLGGQGIGLPGFGLPWGERRVEAPNLQVQLQPPPVPAAAPAPAPLPLTPPPVATPAREVLPQVTLRPRSAAAPATASQIASKARNKAKAKAKVKGKTKIKVKANATAIAKANAAPKTKTNATSNVASQPKAIAEARPATASTSTALRATPPLPDEGISSAVPMAKPEPAVIAIEPPAESTWKVPPPSPEPPVDNTLAANAATPPIAPLPMHEVTETAQKPVETDMLQQPVEVATHEEAVRVEAQRREAARLEAERQEAARAEAARSEAQRVEAARVEAAKLAAAKLEAERREAARIEAERLEAQRREATRLEAQRQEAARAEAARLEAERQEAARQAGIQRESDRTGTGRRESAGQQPGGQAADRAQAEREEDARHEERRRAMGRILDEEAARRKALEASRAQQPALPLSLSTARRIRLWGRSDPNIQLVDYAEAWARRIQLNAPVEIVRDLAKLPHSNPLVTVAIRSDGTIETVTIEVSSGSAAVDAAVRKIVQDTAPYPAFPPALARQYDVIEVRRTWHFDMAIRLY